ncbi:aminotransferase class V-fold PLP-dependent enzyme [Streptomyces sp. NPDC026672]|uniref:aminotransferase class V-fold PLP-dependent enzyme n=1 Tax=unclassified Streptomyces TaxID=2593676 RepID=UPI00340829CF
MQQPTQPKDADPGPGCTREAPGGRTSAPGPPETVPPEPDALDPRLPGPDALDPHPPEPDPLERIRRGIIGEGELVDGPYGPRRVTYADWTASGCSLDFVEDHLRDAVLPRYANTHAESSGNGRRTGRLREEARRVIADAVGAGSTHHVVFCGSGSTAAIDKVVGLLGLRPSPRLTAAGARLPERERPVVFVGPYEHHSNELAWRESLADVVVIREDDTGRLDLDDLRAALETYAHRPLRIGCMSAASNVTGILTDTDAVAALLHRHGALSFWDFATAGPYLPIRVGESAPGRGDHKDAVFLSPHKFVGGPQTPGVLVAHESLFAGTVPVVPGGGTVTYVGPEGHRYTSDPVAREEGGTPAIVESVRAGLVFALKESVGPGTVRAREERAWHHVRDRWLRHPGIHVLGDTDVPRLPVVSFLIRHGEEHLHHHFVTALLDDLFGIQARGGCSCAGPYGHRLLGIGTARSRAYHDVIAEHGYEGVKPGWTRVSFPYFMSDAVREHIVEAVELIADAGHRLLPDYRFDARTGIWRHRAEPAGPVPDLMAAVTATTPPHRGERAGEEILAAHRERARRVLLSGPRTPSGTSPALPPDAEALRWFPLPGTPR